MHPYVPELATYSDHDRTGKILLAFLKTSLAGPLRGCKDLPIYSRYVPKKLFWGPGFAYILKIIGILHVLCEITKSGITDHVKPHVASMRQVLTLVESNPRVLNNTVVRRFKIKLEGRLGVGMLPSRASAVLRRGPTPCYEMSHNAKASD